ncbi:hypothetical protein FSC37_07495 [Piscinibacter aquaticus]|uniref:FecR protein domain-containing protein n=1 Tax=Piscinibacter aquaticus TaxID=392597 RepID=A0A5C6U1S1_9BURK|nr:hypothetical protein FSC37_07495 [Piscinibacter aquaticus]
MPSQRADDAVDPPGRVGRLSEVQGQVWLYHPADGEWEAAQRNRPLTSGDRLATDGGARTEVRIGSTTLRLDGATEIEVLRLDDDRIALQLHNGSVAVRIRSREQVEGFELRTQEGRFTVQRTGRYRFDRADEASFATVLSGRAYYETQNNALSINAGQRAEFWIDRANVPQYSIIEPERDAFAGWVAERDRSDDRSASTRYVSPEMTGVEDLDRYGSWQDNPEYGALWVPRAVAPGWAPYTTGRWAWVAPWGWTWIDEAPWGFAPFHYGRWVYVGSSWCWSPGTYVRRPVYAPALVAWIGGPRLSIGINIGGGGPAVGWVPLAPREVYVPYYRVSPGYVRNVNVTHVTNITNITTIVNNPQQAVGERDFRNRKFPHAVTVVPASTFTSRQPITPVARQLRDAPEVREIVRQPPRASIVAAPPVATPPQVQRRPDMPVARPPVQQAPALRERLPGNGFQPDRPDVVRAAPVIPHEPERAGERDVRREQRDVREQRESREQRDPREQREQREQRDSREIRTLPQPPMARPVQPAPQMQPAQPMLPAQPAQPIQRPDRFEHVERPQPPVMRSQPQIQEPLRPQPVPQPAPMVRQPMPQPQPVQPPPQMRGNGGGNGQGGFRDRPDVGEERGNGRGNGPRQER